MMPRGMLAGTGGRWEICLVPPAAIAVLCKESSLDDLVSVWLD